VSASPGAKGSNGESGVPGAPPTIDKLIHEPARFALMACLYVVEGADFVFLRRQTGLTGGNLSSHMGKLEAAGYVDVEKSFVEKRPQTMFRLTKTGRNAFQEYRATMKDLLDQYG